ncbi:MAG: cyanophycinase [Gemmatimonadetes bacterium]|nr:cyanophycinase [Gemmatimonadota bacterium]
MARPIPRPCRRRSRPAGFVMVPALLAAACASTGVPAPAQTLREPSVGPARGALIIAGGGRLGDDIMGRFLELAGGPAARIVVIPTAGEQDTFPQDWSGTQTFRNAGVAHVTVLHTRDPAVANTAAFVAPLREATGVWIPGGRQWRLADAYLGTRTLDELNRVLERGGVIGGSSAGASIQASYMVRGAPEGNTIMMAEGHEQGFAFLRGAAVDQHLIARGRENDMLEVIAAHPDLLGIGIDEGTAILVRGDRAEVVGRSRVGFYNARDADAAPYYFLEAGDVFDLAERRVLWGERLPATTVDERAVVSAVQNLFDAMRAADTAAVRAAFHADARLLVPGNAPDPLTLRNLSVSDFVRAIGASGVRLDERARDPEVRVDGNLASVWTYYDFYRGDTFSHCGIDAFHLARDAAGWKILQIAYTTRQDGCRR